MNASAHRFWSRLPAAALLVAGLQPVGGAASAHEVAGAPGQPPIHIECRCRANGRTFALGEKVCLQTPSGYRVAECRMEQNVTSWSFAQEECMVNARLDDLARTLRPVRATPLTGP